MTICIVHQKPRGPGYLGAGLERGREGIERKRAHEIAAHAPFDVGEAVGGLRDPIETRGFGELLQFRLNISVANQLRCS